jgi:2-amino-4-hydroxy-6-hydroxymethyldihydropteridine diphosphokinase
MIVVMAGVASSDVQAFVALGSNLGDREENITMAVDALRNSDGIMVRRQSSLLENPAVGGPPDSPPFLNAVAEVRTALPAHELLDRLLDIERQLGRVRNQKWEPRLIDLDLVLYSDQIIDRPQLIVPHPLLHERDFVLRPLVEIAPEALHPRLQMTAREMLQRLAGVD